MFFMNCISTCKLLTISSQVPLALPTFKGFPLITVSQQKHMFTITNVPLLISSQLILF